MATVTGSKRILSVSYNDVTTNNATVDNLLSVRDGAAGSSATDWQRIADLGVLDFYSHTYGGVSHHKFYNGNWTGYYYFNSGSSTGEKSNVRITSSGNVQTSNKIEINDGTAWRSVWHEGDFSSTNISNWNTAYGWGNHASAGYLTAIPDNYVLNSGDTMTGDLTIGTDSSRVALNIRSNSWSEIKFWNDGVEQFRLGSSDGTSSYGTMTVGSFYIYDVSSNQMILELPNNGGSLLRNNGSIKIFDDEYHPNADTWTTTRTNTVTLTGDVSGTGSASVNGSGNWTVSVAADLNIISNDTFTGTYPVAWLATDNLYKSSWFTIDGTNDRLSVPQISTDIVYDRNNTAYYSNPEGTSNLNNLNVNGTFLRAIIGSRAVTDTNKLLSIEGNYTNGLYTHRFRKQDIGGGVPMSLDYTQGTAGSYSELVRWGPFSGDGGYRIRHYDNVITYGVHTATTDMRSPLFYDDNNTSYYVDPNGTSNIATLNVATINRNPTVTLSGDVTGSATMTNLGSINITTTVANSVVHSRGSAPADLNDAGMGVWRVNTGHTNQPSTNFNYGTLISFDNSSDTGFQMIASYNSTNDLRWRGGNSSVYGGTGSFQTWQRIFHDSYHPNADKWTTARTNTVTLTGSVTGSGSASVDGSGNWTVTVPTTTNHTHNYDNYGSWTAKDHDGTTYTVTSGDTLWFKEGSAIDVNFTADDELTISHADTSSQGSVNNSNGTVIQDVTLDGHGHVTGLASVDLDGRYALISHKYHSFGNGQYFFDNYEQGNNFRVFTENFKSDNIRHGNIYNVEYYNGSAWVAWSGGDSAIQAILDGNENTGTSIDHTHRQFRFTVQASTGWPTGALFFLQTTWTAISYPGITVTIEDSTSSGGTFTLRETAVFTSSNTGSTWGTHAKYATTMHNGATFYRFTVNITDWTDNGSYTTVPIRRIALLSNYSGDNMDPYSVAYDKRMNLEGGLSAVGSIHSPIFYDYNNTSYYVDPASQSVINTLTASNIQAPIYYDSDDTNYYVNPSATSRVSKIEFVDANTRIEEGSSNSLRIQTGTGYGDLGSMNSGWFHLQTDRPAFYTNKPFYVDGNIFVYNTQSQLTSSSVRAPIFYDSNNTAYYVDPASQSVVNTLTVSNIQAPLYTDSDNSSYYVDPNGTSNLWAFNANYLSGIATSSGGHLLTVRKVGAGYSDGSACFNAVLDNATGSASWAFHARAGGTTASETFKVRADGYTYLPRLYDINNTAYYLDPASTSILKTVSMDAAIVTTSMQIAVDVTANGSVRAPIFYDSNITSYYVDPAGDSVLSKMYLADQLRGGIGAKTTAGTTDWNDSSNARSGNGYTLLLGTHPNGPGGSNYYHPFSFEYNSKDGSGNMTQFAFDYSGATGPFFRTRYSGAWTGWTRLWNSSNDGSGSGLDADLLDGQHGSYYATASSLSGYVSKSGDTMTGDLVTTSGDSNGIFIGTGGANITSVTPSSKDVVVQDCAQFRMGGPSWDWNNWAGWAWAGGTNPIYFGGPASSAFTSNASPPTPPLLLSGVSYTQSDGSMRAPIFYDSDNTAFYVNPASQSVLNTVTINNVQAPIYYDSDNTAYYLNAAGTSRLNQTDTNYCDIVANNAYGLRFWNGDSGYRIHMSSSTDTTNGGRVAGETTSDYNMYFTMANGTNRGFVFRNANAATGAIAGIDASGNARFEGDVVAYSASDKRLKENIKPIDSALDKVSKLGGYEFDWNDKQTVWEDGKHDVGVIAQEVLEVMPEAVKVRSDSYLGVDYEKLVPLLIQAVKELQAEVKSLKEK